MPFLGFLIIPVGQEVPFSVRRSKFFLQPPRAPRELLSSQSCHVTQLIAKTHRQVTGIKNRNFCLLPTCFALYLQQAELDPSTGSSNKRILIVLTTLIGEIGF